MFTETKQRHRYTLPLVCHRCMFLNAGSSLQWCPPEIRGSPPGSLSFILLLLEGVVNQATRVASELSKGFQKASPDRKFGRKLS